MSFISFREDIGAILQNAYAEDADDEGTYFAKNANIVRREILNCSVRFEGTVDESSQKVSVPKTLVTLLSMMINGSNLTLKANHEKCLQAATLSFNFPITCLQYLQAASTVR